MFSSSPRQIVSFLWIARRFLGRPWQAAAVVALIAVALAIVGAANLDVSVVSLLTDPIWISVMLSGLLASEWLRRRPGVP